MYRRNHTLDHAPRAMATIPSQQPACPTSVVVICSWLDHGHECLSSVAAAGHRGRVTDVEEWAARVPRMWRCEAIILSQSHVLPRRCSWKCAPACPQRFGHHHGAQRVAHEYTNQGEWVA